MNLYIWEDVLQDWTSGLIVVIARSAYEANELFTKKAEPVYHYGLFLPEPVPELGAYYWAPIPPSRVIPLDPHTEPQVWFVPGGS